MKQRIPDPRRISTCGTLAVLALVTLAAAPAGAQTVSNTRGLAFGSVVPGGTSGTVTVAPDGSRSCSADTTCVPQGPGHAAEFEVTGEALRNYTITVPASATLNNGASENMIVDTFKDSEGGSGTIGVDGDMFTVGATLNVGAGQPRGSYSGTFEVMVEYQ